MSGNRTHRHRTTGAFLTFFLFLAAMATGPAGAVPPTGKPLPTPFNDEPCPPIIVPAAPCEAAAMLRQAVAELERMLSQATNVAEMESIRRRLYCTGLDLARYERQCAEASGTPPPGKPLPGPGPSPVDPGTPMCPPMMLPDAPCAAAAMLRDRLEELSKQLSRATTPGEIQSIQHEMYCVKTSYGRYEEQCAGEGMPGQPGKPMPGPAPVDPDTSVCPGDEFAAWMRQNPCGLLMRLKGSIEELQRELSRFPPFDVPVTGVTELQRAMVARRLQCHLEWMEKVRQAVAASDPTLCGTQPGNAPIERFGAPRPGGPPLHERVPSVSAGDSSHARMCEELNRRLQEIMGRINQGQPVQGTVILQVREIESRIRQFCTGDQSAPNAPGRGVPGGMMDRKKP